MALRSRSLVTFVRRGSLNSLLSATGRHLGRLARPTPGRAEHGSQVALRFPDCSDAGTFATGVCDWQVGDVFIGDGNRHYRIVAMTDTAEGMASVWEVEPAEGAVTRGALIDPDPPG